MWSTAALSLGVLFFICCGDVFVEKVSASKLEIEVFYPESNLDWNFIATYYPDMVFGLSIESCQSQYNTTACPGGSQAFDNHYGIYNKTDWVGPNHWIKTFDLGDEYIGEVQVQLIAMQWLTTSADGSTFAITSSVPQCMDQQANFEITAQYCEQPGSPYYVTVTDTSAQYHLTTFPWFGLDGGEVVGGSTGVKALAGVYSPQLNNKRNISVYIPPSIMQNTIPRVVNAMFMMDGELSITQAFAFRGGFEEAVVTGVAPESILIGVPSTSDIFSTNPNTPYGLGERTYEMTFNVCNASLMNCETSGYTVDNTGGMDKLLDFCIDNVLPLVLKTIGMQQGGEVSISGMSLGGLTSVYAVGTRPQQFSRGWSLEGDTPYNFGQVSQKITEAYASTGVRGKAIVMQVGSSAYSVFSNPSTGEVLNELDFMVQTDQAFQSTGYKPMNYQCLAYTAASMPQVEYPYTTACAAPDSVVATFLQKEGQHSIQSWITIFSMGLPTLYSSQFAAINSTYKQRVYVQEYLSNPDAYFTSSSSANDGNSNNKNANGIIVALTIMFVITLVACMVLIYLLLKKSSSSSEGAMANSSDAKAPKVEVTSRA